MKITLLLNTLSLVTGAVALVLFYRVGGWELLLAAFLYGWSLNLDNRYGKRKGV